MASWLALLGGRDHHRTLTRTNPNPKNDFWNGRRCVAHVHTACSLSRYICRSSTSSATPEETKIHVRLRWGRFRLCLEPVFSEFVQHMCVAVAVRAPVPTSKGLFALGEVRVEKSAVAVLFRLDFVFREQVPRAVVVLADAVGYPTFDTENRINNTCLNSSLPPERYAKRGNDQRVTDMLPALQRVGARQGVCHPQTKWISVFFGGLIWKIDTPS